MPTGSTYQFGPFELDAAARRLMRDREPVAISDRQLEILLQLVSQAGAVMSKDGLIEAAWSGVAVTDNSLEQAISGLRRLLAADSTGEPYIETVPRRGYRFTATVTRVTRRETDADLDALLAPHRAWLEGRAALETLERDQVTVALHAFERVLESNPDYASAHLGLANASGFKFEMTRTDDRPDLAALERAIHHAREACRLDPATAESWATLAFVLRHLDADQAVAAARRATALEPDNWRHQLRLAYVSWGEERLRAADRALKLLPGLALAHWLLATVHVARQAFEAAERELAAGAAAQDGQRTGSARFQAVGLHWLRGLVRLERGDHTAAREAFDRELSFEGAGHLYARECAANTWYAIGAMALHAGRTDEAVSALDEALKRVPSHTMAVAARRALAGRDVRLVSGNASMSAAIVARPGAAVDMALGGAVECALAGDHRLGAARVMEALSGAAADAAGWLLPVDPIIQPGVHAAEWAGVLALLRARAA